MSIGSHLIDDARSRAGLSQGELAEGAGTSRTAICAYESGAKDHFVAWSGQGDFDLGLRSDRGKAYEILLPGARRHHEVCRWSAAFRPVG
jgi:Helix-turn-helix domain